MTEHEVGTREEWLAARTELLAGEKEPTRRSDELACEGCTRDRDVLNGTWQLLDRAPKGRDEQPEDWPRRRYEYEGAPL